MKALYALLNKKTQKNVEYAEPIDEDLDNQIFTTIGYDIGKVFIEENLNNIKSLLSCLKMGCEYDYFQKVTSNLKEDVKNGDIVIVKLTQEIIEE